MNRPTAIILAAGAATLAACGSAAAPSATASTSHTVVTAVAAPTPSANAADAYPFMASLAGTYAGHWSNTTFGSTGTITWTITANAQARTVTILVSLTGQVLGMPAPGPETIELTHLAQGTISGPSPAFGAVTGTISPQGDLHIVMTKPTATIQTVTVTGTLAVPGISLAYAVAFTSGSTASGTVTMTRQ